MIFGVNVNNEIEVVGEFSRSDLTRIDYDDKLGFFTDKDPTDYCIEIADNSVMITPRQGWIERIYARKQDIEIGKIVTDLDLANIELGQQNTDLELRLLALEGK